MELRSKPVALDEDDVAEFAKLGVTVPASAVTPVEQEEGYAIAPSIWPSFLLFNRLSTQWRVSTLAQRDGTLRIIYHGLDYQAAESLMRTLEVEYMKSSMRDLMEMESAALPVINGGAPRKEDELWPTA